MLSAEWGKERLLELAFSDEMEKQCIGECIDINVEFEELKENIKNIKRMKYLIKA